VTWGIDNSLIVVARHVAYRRMFLMRWLWRPRPVIREIRAMEIKTDASERSKLSSPEGLREYLLGFSVPELRRLSSSVGVEFDSLSGNNKQEKIKELLTSVEHRGRFDEFFLDVMRPFLEKHLDATADEEVKITLKKIDDAAETIALRNKELTARILLPERKHLNVPLAPVHSLERLEEYRSDENIAYLLTGAFVGAILGILSNWADNDPFVLTRISIVLMILLVILTIFCVIWAIRLNRRATSVKKDILSGMTTLDEGQ
jgi:hypothetical protein